MKKIQLIEVNSEIGAGTRGASLGVPALKIASLNKKSPIFQEYPTIEVANKNHLLFDSAIPSFPHAKKITAVVDMCAKIGDNVQQSLEKQQFPLVLSGDHSNAGGTIIGIKKQYPHLRLGVIWIDAHADIHTPFTTPSGNLHGMPLGAALGLSKEGRRGLNKPANNVDTPAIEAWQQLQNLGEISPKLKAEDLVFIGVRDTEEEENYLIEHFNIRNFTVDEVHKKRAEQIAQEALAYLQNCDLIYISFDVDSLDSDTVSHGTGTPVSNGLFVVEAKNLLQKLLQNEKVVCFEMTEINPVLDKHNSMAEYAFSILETVVSSLEDRFELNLSVV